MCLSEGNHAIGFHRCLILKISYHFTFLSLKFIGLQFSTGTGGRSGEPRRNDIDNLFHRFSKCFHWCSKCSQSPADHITGDRANSHRNLRLICLTANFQRALGLNNKMMSYFTLMDNKPKAACHINPATTTALTNQIWKKSQTWTGSEKLKLG